MRLPWSHRRKPIALMVALSPLLMAGAFHLLLLDDIRDVERAVYEFSRPGGTHDRIWEPLVSAARSKTAAGGSPEAPRVVGHVVVYSEPGRFAGWPANHGIWSWGEEILVGCSRGYYQDRGRFHHIDHDR